MNNNLYIDDLNVLGRFGCRVTRGGYNDLLAFPAMKEPEKNDWPEAVSYTHLTLPTIA